MIPRKQSNPAAARKLLETLAFGLVEVETATKAFEEAGIKYEEGDFIIRMQQPYSSFAKALLEKQNYPDLRMYPGGPPKRPYDVTAHTLPMLMGVKVSTLRAEVAWPVNTCTKGVKRTAGLMRTAALKRSMRASGAAPSTSRTYRL